MHQHLLCDLLQPAYESYDHSGKEGRSKTVRSMMGDDRAKGGKEVEVMRVVVAGEMTG